MEMREKADRSAEKAAKGGAGGQIAWLTKAIQETAKAECWTSCRKLQDSLDRLWSKEGLIERQDMELNRDYA